MFDFLSLLKTVPGLIADFKGTTSAPYQPQQDQTAARLAQIAAAQTDTSNPLYKQLYGQFQDQNRQSLAQTIAEAQGQNRMNTGMGRTPLFSPERGGETIFRNLMQGYQGMGQQADLQTRSALQGASSNTNTAGNYYNAITPTTAEANKKQVLGYGGISDFLSNLMSGNQQQGSPSPYAPIYGGNNVSGNSTNNISGGGGDLAEWLKRNQQPVISGGY